MFLRRRSMGYAIVLLAGIGCAVSAVHLVEAQEARPTFRASVALVPISAVVRDRKNRVVRELRKDDFEVLEENQPRRVIDFSATDRGPVTLGVLFDTSGSMHGVNLETGRAAVDRLLEQLWHASDRAALFTFDKTLSSNIAFSLDVEGIRQALRGKSGWGVTSLYDAIAETAKRIGERTDLRRAIVVVTDGVDTSSELSAPEVSGIASAINVPVYVVSISAPRRTADGEISRDDGLTNLARWTGGELLHVPTAAHAAAAVAALMDELRQQYFLAIESAQAAGWYRLDVRTKRKGLSVRARSGYVAD